MSDLDTDALRILARDVDNGWGTETSPSLRAAADTIDALRAEFARVDGERSHLAAARDSLINAVRAATAERDSLRRIVAEAPHEDTCATRLSPDAGYPCSCWKSRIEETR